MRKLKLNSGSGYSGVRELGLFEVKYNNAYIRFRILTIARDFYDNLEVEKSIWQIEPTTELLECHSY